MNIFDFFSDAATSQPKEIPAPPEAPKIVAQPNNLDEHLAYVGNLKAVGITPKPGSMLG